MNLNAYAKHRKESGLRGTTHVAVIHAINSGRLTPPAIRREGRGWVIDPVLADAQWAMNTDPSARNCAPEVDPAVYTPKPKASASQPKPPPIDQQEQPPTGVDSAAVKGMPNLAMSKAVKAAFDAKLAQLDYQRQSGELVPAKEVKESAFAMARAVRDRMLGITDRLAPVLAATTDARKVHQLLDEEIRVALRGMADG